MSSVVHCTLTVQCSPTVQCSLCSVLQVVPVLEGGRAQIKCPLCNDTFTSARYVHLCLYLYLYLYLHLSLERTPIDQIIDR